VDDAAEFRLGTECQTGDGSKFVYCQLPAIVVAGSALAISELFVGTLLTTLNSDLGDRVGWAPALATVGQYGWVQVNGVVDNMYVGASCAANVKINTTATGGMLDDDATAGAKMVLNAALTTARAASNGVAPGECAPEANVGVTL
jgi:hypothetical protein